MRICLLRTKMKKEDIAIKLWIPTSILDLKSIPCIPPPLLHNLAFLFYPLSIMISPGEATTSYSIGFSSKFQKYLPFNDFTHPCRAGVPLETQARDRRAERQQLQKPTMQKCRWEPERATSTQRENFWTCNTCKC